MPYARIALEGKAGLYEWHSGTGSAASGGWTGYLLTAGADEAQLTAQNAWEGYWGTPTSNVNGGIYLFMPERPSDPIGFLQRLLTYIARLNGQASNLAYRYLLWIQNPNSGSDIEAQAINFARSGEGQRGSVKEPARLIFRNIQLQVAQGVDLLADYDPPAFTLRPFGAATLQFVNTIGQVSEFGTVTSPARIEVDGGAPGRTSMTMQVSAVIPQGDNDLRKMRTGVEYFKRTDGGLLSGHLYPVLNKTATSQFFFQVQVDPLHPLDGSRTAFTFIKDPKSGAAPPRFESYFATDRGHTVWLTPKAGEAGFVLQPEMYPVALLHDSPQTPTYYFTPTGSFVIAYNPEPPASKRVGEPVGPASLLCGLAGVEVLSFDPPGAGYEGDILRFIPDQPAYAPVFPLPQVNLRAPNSPAVTEHLLTGAWTTAWATISREKVEAGAPGPSGPNRYYSQPNGAPYYGPDKGATAADGPPILAFAPTITADLSGGPAMQPFPLVPYGGTAINAQSGFSPDQIPVFESQIISPTRKQQVLQIKQRAGLFDAPRRAFTAEETRTITTPQGLLATVAGEPATHWQSLLLARNVVKETTYNLAFKNLDQVLQDAFQTNQQFLVMTRAPNAEFQNLISIEGWPFRIQVGERNTLGDYNNVLLFKFMKGKLSELVKNPSNWTSAAQFNQTEGQGLAFLSQWLQDYIEQARQMAEFEKQQGGRESYFQHFLDIVDSETWNGILALKVDIGLGDFPPMLKGLTAGIDLTRFNAHHLGVEVNFVQVGADGRVDFAGNSSLFGLIYYMDAAYETQLTLGGSPDRPVQASAGDYDFKVLTLKVLFENTAIKTFESKLQVTVNRWFGDRVLGVVDATGRSLGLPSNSIILDGAYEEHDGQPVFTFASRSDRLFRLESNVLGVVEVVQTQFSTLTDHGGPNGDQVQSRFTFTGLLNFMPAEKFDLFSFGTDWTANRPGSGQGLYASNLYLDLVFPSATPAQRSFAFNSTAMAINLEQSRVRDGSLFKNFPLKLVGMTAGKSDQGPAKLGYLPVSMEGPAFKGLKGDWHGLLFQLELGTMGALAENAGLTAQLLAVWSPASGGTQGTYDVQVGLKLPGTGGEGKLLSLQGVLKLSVDDIQLLIGETKDKRPAFMLKLTQIGLKFLGVKFPTSGNTVFFLFGDPNPGAPQSSLGWYAAYNKEKPPKLAESGKGGGEG